MAKKRIPRSKLRFTLLKWHRRFGAFLAFIIFLLCLTGIALNHTEELQLDEQQLSSSWLLQMYGVKRPDIPKSFQTAEHWFTGVGDHFYVNGYEVGYCPGLKGVVNLDELFVVACEDNLILLTSNLEVVERLGASHGLPQPFSRIGRQNNALVVEGELTRRFDIDQLALLQLSDEDVFWPVRTNTPEHVEKIILDSYSVDGLNWERLILDFHSGRLFGKAGVLFVDLAAVLFMFLAGSGFWLWWRRP